MDRDTLKRDLQTTFRLVVDEERWLFVGTVAVVVAYALWVGISGAAVDAITEFLDVTLTTGPWGTTEKALVALLAVLWLVVPAAAVVRLAVRRVTNQSGNLARQYRLMTPAALLVPPALGVFVLGAAAVALGDVPTPLLLVLVWVALFLATRALTYSYRVFSLSTPRAGQAILLCSTATAFFSVLSYAALSAERGDLVERVADATESGLGVTGVTTRAVGEVSRGGVQIPTVLLAAIAVPAALVTAYVLLQLAASLVTRLRKPDIPRNQIRGGQHYPEVVWTPLQRRRAGRTTGTGAGGGTGTGTDTGSETTASSKDTTSAAGTSSDAAKTGTSERGPTGTEAASAAASGDAGSDDATDDSANDDVSHTRVFTPPDDGDDVGPQVGDGTGAGSAQSGTDGNGPATETDSATDDWGRDTSPTDDVTGEPSVGPQGDATGDDAGSTDATVSADESADAWEWQGDSDTADDDATDSAEITCSGCSRTFSADTGYMYCPNCGETLDD
jgi:hypothetical protein